MNVTKTTPAFYDSMIDGGDESDFDDTGIMPLQAYFFFIYFILIFGLIGNTCVIALMQSRDFHNLSYSVYLRVLAVTDSFLLMSVCTEDILEHNFDLLHDFVTSSVALCKIWTYFRSVLGLVSPWLVVTLTFDRFVAVVFPLKRAMFCSRRAAIITSSVLVGSIICESLFYLILYKPDYQYNEYDCLRPESKAFLNYEIFRALTAETMLPCMFILILNVNIIIGINRSRKFRAAVGSNQPDGVKTSRIDKATVSLLAVSVMAFIALLPISIMQAVEEAWDAELTKREETMDTNNIEQVQALESDIERRDRAGGYWTALNIVYLFNFGQNFYVMLITGPKYRQIVASWFRCLDCYRRKDSSAEAVTAITREVNKAQG